MLDASYPTPLLLAWMGPLWAEFTAPTARHALVLVTGAVLAPARRTVAAALRATGYGQEADFTNYHRVLNRNRWSPRPLVTAAWARRLLLLLVQVFTPQGPVIIGIDDTLERCWARRSKRAGSTGIPSAPATAASSRRAACDGSRSCCCRRSPEPGASGRCRFPQSTILRTSILSLLTLWLVSKIFLKEKDSML